MAILKIIFVFIGLSVNPNFISQDLDSCFESKSIYSEVCTSYEVQHTLGFIVMDDDVMLIDLVDVTDIVLSITLVSNTSLTSYILEGCGSYHCSEDVTMVFAGSYTATVSTDFGSFSQTITIQ